MTWQPRELEQETDHVLSVREWPVMSGGPFYRSFCSCGSYFSGTKGSPEAAGRDGLQHVYSKIGYPVKSG